MKYSNLYTEHNTNIDLLLAENQKLPSTQYLFVASLQIFTVPPLG